MKTRVLLLFAWLGAGAALADGEVADAPLPLDELRVFAEVFGKIKDGYVDPTDDAELLRDALRGMLSGLDPHSAFLGPKAFRAMRESAEGRFGGLGIEVIGERGVIKVVAPLDDTPAQRAGIQPGDVIVKLDGRPVRAMTLREAVDAMRGAPGSAIVVTLSRGGGDAFDLEMRRAVIKIPSVKSEVLEPGFIYLRITAFQGGTGASLRAAIERHRRAGDIRGLVLDLRNNPGGVLQSAVAVSDAFLDAGVIVSVRGRGADADHAFHATAGDLTADAPLVALVNGGTASAAEIVAGALQDHRRAIIMGARTFGKGSVQTVLPVNNGGALKLTTARYYTPADRSIQARGIAPDIALAAAPPAAAERAPGPLREADLAGHLENAGGEGDATARRADLATRDHQIGAALNLLKGMSLVADRRPADGG